MKKLKSVINEIVEFIVLILIFILFAFALCIDDPHGYSELCKLLNKLKLCYKFI